MRGIWAAGIGIVIAVGLLAQAPARGAGTKCADVEVHNPSKTQGVGAQQIRARGTTCRSARHIAKVVAKVVLVRGEDHVPKTIAGYHVVVKDPGCASCAPVWPAIATKPGARVTFTLLGGA